MYVIAYGESRLALAEVIAFDLKGMTAVREAVAGPASAVNLVGV
jgi:hypothetical protein